MGFIGVRKLEEAVAVAATETVSSSGVLAVSVDPSGLTARTTNVNGSHRKISESLLSHIQLIGVITGRVFYC